MQDDKDFGNRSDVDRLNEFCAAFASQAPTPEAALEALCLRVESMYGKNCTYCGSERTERKPGNRIRRCRDCRKLRSITAGTMFHNVRDPRPWECTLGSIDEGIVCSKADYARATHVTWASANLIYNKVMKPLGDEVMNNEYLLQDSSSFLPVYGRRSRETPAKEPPSAEQTEFERQQGYTDEFRQDVLTCAEIGPGVNVFDLIPQARDIHTLLAEAPRSTDELIEALPFSVGDVLSGVTILEIAGLVFKDPQGRMTLEAKTIAGFSSGAKVNVPCADHIESISVAIAYIRKCSQFVSRKYVQLYLIAHWWRKQKHLWNRGIVFAACAAAGYIRGKDLANYVSPMRLKVAT